jgi:hypothetical protein
MAPIGDFHWQIARSEWNLKSTLVNVCFLPFELVSCHGVTEHIQLCRERELVKLCTIILVALDMLESELLDHRMSR